MNLSPVFDQDNVGLAMKIVCAVARLGLEDPVPAGKPKLQRAVEECECFAQDWAEDLQSILEAIGGIDTLLVDGDLPSLDVAGLERVFAGSPLAFIPPVLALAGLHHSEKMELTSEMVVEDGAMEAGRALDLAGAFLLANGETLNIWHKGHMPAFLRPPR